jgi:DNA-nicking Smr family endonuclease
MRRQIEDLKRKAEQGSQPRSAKLPATNTPDRAEDDDAFAMAMRDVVRLEPDPRGRVRSEVPINPPARSPRRTEHADVAVDHFVAAGVDRREIRKLTRGEYTVRARRDLHGITAEDALASVSRFIENSRHAGHRCICIVHGRGLHSKDNQPILKTRVRKYLRSHRSVLAYADAPGPDGGSGAVYVLLRKPAHHVRHSSDAKRRTR